MNKLNGKSIKINFIMNSLLTVAMVIFPLISYRFVSRALLPEGVGKVSLAFAFVSYFSMFAQLGIPTYGLRACANLRNDKDDLSKIVRELFLLNLITCAISYTILIMLILFLPSLKNEMTLYLIASITLILNTFGMEWLYKGLEEYTYITISSLAFKLLSLLLILLLIRKPNDYKIYSALYLLSTSGSFILNFVRVTRYVDLKSKFELDIKQHIKPALTFFAMSCAATIYLQMDKVMLGIMQSETEVGYYDAAMHIKTALVSIVTSLSTVLLPRASYYIQNHNETEFYNISQKSISFCFLLASPLIVYFIVFSKQCIYFLSGPAFEKSILPMKIIMFTLLLIGLSHTFGIQMLIPLKKEKFMMYSQIAGAVVNLIINALLIPRFSVVGAAIGTVCAELTVTAGSYFSIRKKVNILMKNVNYFKIIAALLAGGFISFWAVALPFSNLLVLIISSILYFGTYAAVLLLLKEPLSVEIFRSAIKLVIKK